MKAIPLHVALAAAFFALAGSAVLLAPAGAQDYRSKQPGPAPCDCSCGAEHCQKPKPKPMKEITLKRGWSPPDPKPADAYKAAPR